VTLSDGATFNLQGAAQGATDTITAGNGTNLIVDSSLSGTVKITVGTGANLIMLGDNTGGALNGNNTNAAGQTGSTASYFVTLGAHTASTGADWIFVPDAGNSPPGAPNTVITGAAPGDVITTHDPSPLGVMVLSQANLTQLANMATLQSAVLADAVMMGAAHTVSAFQWGGNTYVVEQPLSGVNMTVHSTVVELVGVHTIVAAGSGGFMVQS
jgi:hypothetical protein